MDSVSSQGDGVTACAHCGRPFGAAARRCFYCGAIKGRQCPTCKAVVPVGAQVCLVCKRDVPPATPNYVLESPYAGEAVSSPLTPAAPVTEDVTPKKDKFVFGKAILIVIVVVLLIAGGLEAWFLCQKDVTIYNHSPFHPDLLSQIPPSPPTSIVPTNPISVSTTPPLPRTALPRAPDNAVKSGESSHTPLISKSPCAVDAVMPGRYLWQGGRGFIFNTVPAELRGGSYLLRNVKEGRKWLPANGVFIGRECYLYLAIMSGCSGRQATDTDLEKLKTSGWEHVPIKLETTMTKGEHWRWSLFRRKVPAGVLDVKDGAGVAGCPLIFMFIEARPSTSY